MPAHLHDPVRRVLDLAPDDPRAVAALLALRRRIERASDAQHEAVQRWAQGADARIAQLVEGWRIDQGRPPSGRPLPLTLGPWQLDALAGGGGMGAVYRARHLVHPLQAAVKVVKPASAFEGDTLDAADTAEALRREAAVVARLRHPGIASVLDTGVVGRAAERASQGRIAHGSRYVVSEWVPGGELRARCGALSHPDMKRVLLGLLDALAHAHAHGILHLDIKPNNVLLTGPESNLRPILVDFGLAYVKGRRRGAWTSSGTPPYMAPERFANQWRRFGAPTDLFAVGCLAVTMLTGRPPFYGGFETVRRQVGELARAADEGFWTDHLLVPDALRPWIARCTAFDPADRFPTAAACARALSELTLDDVGRADAENGASLATVGFDTFVLDLDEVLPAHTPSVAAAQPLAPLPVAAPLRAPVNLPAVALRHGFPELVVWPHRQAIDALWAQLRAVEERGGPHVMELAGGTGADRAAVRTWVGREIGGRGWWWARLQPRQGLAAAARDWLDAEQLQGHELRAQLAWRFGAHIDDAWIAALAEGLAHDDGLDAALATLRRMGSVRPILLTVPDQRPREVDDLVARARALQVPLLLVRSHDAGARDDDPPPVARLTMPDRPVLATLLQNAAGLHGALAAQLVDHGAGSLAHATAELTALAAIDALVPGPDGLELLPGTAPVTSQRPTEAVPSEVGPWLSLASALGGDGTWPLLSAAARQLGHDTPPEGLDHYLVTSDAGALLFTEPHYAHACPPTTTTHRAVRDALQQAGALAHRVAFHALRADEPPRAVAPVVAGLRSAYMAGDTAEARTLLAAWPDLARAAGITSDDPEWVEALYQATVIDWWREEAAAQWARQLVDCARDPQLLAYARLSVLRAHHQHLAKEHPDQHQAVDADEVRRLGVIAYQGDWVLAAESAWTEAVVHDLRGDMAAKTEAMERSFAAGLRSGRPDQEVKSLFVRALDLIDRGHLEDGAEAFVVAARRGSEVGAVRRQLSATRGASAFLRVVGRNEEAREMSIQAVRLGRHADEPLQELDLAMLDFATGRTEAARSGVRRVQGLMSTRSHDAQWLRRAALSARVVLEADTLPDDDYRPLVDDLETQLARGVSRQVQLGWFLEEGAVSAAHGRRKERARWLGTRAVHWYRLAGQEDIAQRVRRRLHEAGGPSVVPK